MPAARCGSAEAFIAGRGMFDRGRPLKRWRWVGVFSEELMVCAAQVRIGPARQSFWALPRTARGGDARAHPSAAAPRRGRALPRPAA